MPEGASLISRIWLLVAGDESFGQRVSGPDQHGDNPENCAVDVMRSHDLRPKIAADARGHAEEHQAEGEREPTILLFKLSEVAAVTEQHACCDREGDHCEAADQREVQ